MVSVHRILNHPKIENFKLKFLDHLNSLKNNICKLQLLKLNGTWQVGGDTEISVQIFLNVLEHAKVLGFLEKL